MNRVDGKIALVTGGSRGLGAAAARKLAEGGARILITDVRVEAGEETATQFQKRGHDVHFTPHDVTSEDDWERVVGVAEERLGGLDILVNNAGVAEGGPVAELTLESWRRVMDVNLDGVFLGIKHAAPAIRKRADRWPGGGSIINISSIMGIVAGGQASAYCASKGAVRLLTKSAALELAQESPRIRVNSVHPGYIDTDMVAFAMSRMAERGIVGSPNEARDFLIMRHPIGRLGEPDDIANAVRFLASDASSFVTGTEVVVDGGYIAQ